MILPAFRRSHHDRNIHALYGAIVAQARSAAFYTAYGVPDTVEGRFELIVLHLVLVLARLGRPDEGAPGGGRGPTRAFGQQLFDVFCRDLDDNLREMGVGDLAVPREMRRFGEAFYGRQAAYAAALMGDDDRKLEKAFARNIFAVAGGGARAAQLARYARAAASALDTQEEGVIVAGKVVFPGPELFAHG
jgi:cytochrome b pre-mRNA-processing protein 3